MKDHRGYRMLFRASLLSVLALCAMPTHAADNLDMKVTTPSIEKLRAALIAHSETLAPYKTKGAIGEGRDGLLAVRDLESAGLSLLEKKKARELMAAENADRKALYREILLANGQSADNEERVKAVMTLAAKEHADKAGSQDWVQDPNSGAWVKAKDLH